MEENIFNLIYKFLEIYDIKVDKEEVKMQLMTHPDYPSLFSITDLFNHFKIESSAFEVPVEPETLDYFEDSFLAQFNKGQDKIIVLVKIENDDWEVSTDGKKFKKITKEVFLKMWTGICLLIEKPESLDISSNKKSLLPLSIASILIPLVLVFSFGFNSGIEFINFALLLLGTTLSVLIVFQELEINSYLGDKICNSEDNVGCNSIIKSNSKLLGLKLSDLTILFFSSYSLFWIATSFLGFANYTFPLIVAFLGIPISLYSLYVQKFVLKDWCKLCLGTVAILFAQAGLFYFMFGEFVFNKEFFTSTLIFGVFGIISAGIWFPLKKLIKDKQELKKAYISNARFKRDHEVFDTIFKREDELPKENISNEIVLGNPNGSFEIMMVTHPLCKYCKEKHEILDKILELDNENIKIILRFNSSAESLTHVRDIIPLRLLEIYHEQPNDIMEALHDIFGYDHEQNYWVEKWNKPSKPQYLQVLKDEKAWCDQNEINFTPLPVINGRKFPEKYEFEDMLYFIDEMIEERENEVSQLLFVS
ncbi:vitamin K epoxide reductase family protein [Aureivirga sp. CE67]|uniref:vitamin K epoxide reductase family protein n=1 Tax=Aureivirga sp. CE67 TaxID=1788983 RepID=UPI0018CA4514|nr:vitamin K epoxide reductase family protein [Aureivirga sp. CE67]